MEIVKKKSVMWIMALIIAFTGIWGASTLWDSFANDAEASWNINCFFNGKYTSHWHWSIVWYTHETWTYVVGGYTYDYFYTWDSVWGYDDRGYRWCGW